MTLYIIPQAARIHRINRSRLDLAIRRGRLATHGTNADGAPLVESSEVAALLGSRWARPDHRHDDLWDRAVCRQPGMDPEMWFPEDSDIETQHRAIKLCHQCPLATHCLDMEMDCEKGKGEKYRFGIFGGTTPRQRYRMEFSRKERK